MLAGCENPTTVTENLRPTVRTPGPQTLATDATIPGDEPRSPDAPPVRVAEAPEETPTPFITPTSAPEEAPVVLVPTSSPSPTAEAPDETPDEPPFVAERAPDPVPATTHPAYTPDPVHGSPLPPVAIRKPVTPTTLPSPVPPGDRPVVYDPLDTNGRKRAKHYGIYGKIYSLLPSQTRYSASDDYAAYGRELGVDLYMSQINIPARPFHEGFRPNGGKPLMSASGKPLLEYFGMQLETELVLGPKDEPGLYQLGIISDDGSNVRLIDADGSVESLIAFESSHAPGLGCAVRAVEMSRDTRLHVRIGYYQGPRYQLSLMLLWRKVPDTLARDLADPLCGKYGVNLLFNPRTTPTTPLKPYKDLLKRGWQLLDNRNFLVPQKIRSERFVPVTK